MVRPAWFAPLVMILGVSALAQAPVPPPPPQEGGGPPSARAERRETVRLFVVHKMRENLGLSEAQTLNVLDALEAIDKERDASGTSHRALFERMQALLADPSTPEAAYRDAVTQFQRSLEASETRMRDLEAKLLATMTPKQQVQFILLRRQLLDDLRQDIQAPRQGRPGGRWRQ